jgi:hypothetical protein
VHVGVYVLISLRVSALGPMSLCALWWSPQGVCNVCVLRCALCLAVVVAVAMNDETVYPSWLLLVL